MADKHEVEFDDLEKRLAERLEVRLDKLEKKIDANNENLRGVTAFFFFVMVLLAFKLSLGWAVPIALALALAFVAYTDFRMLRRRRCGRTYPLPQNRQQQRFS
jgi:Flp pilus assembly protein TadB